MKFTCDRCDAQYLISDEKIGPSGVKVRCKKCSHVILVRHADNGASLGEVPVPAPSPTPSGEGLDAELGQAFDNAFGGPAGGEVSAEGVVAATAPKVDLDSTQAVSPEEADKLAAGSAAPEPAATEWYVAIGQAQVGPLPLVEVRRKWETGDIGPDSLVWRPGMGDWAALNGVSDLAAYLAPVPRGAVRPKPAPTPVPTTRTAAAMPAAASPLKLSRSDVSWKPAGASALAALASEELAAQPEAQGEPKPMVTAKSLMEGLPDGGGVDPTGAIPLQIKALEETGEQPVKSSVARGAEKLRKKRSSTRALVATIVFLLLALGAGAGYVFKDQLLGSGRQPPPPRVAQALPADKPTPVAEPPKAVEPAATPAAAVGTATGGTATDATPTGTTAPSAQPAAEPKLAEPKAPEPAKAEVKEPEPKPVVAVKEPERKHDPAKTARERERERTAEKRQPPVKVARAETGAPAPAPAPAKKGDVLDFDNSNDAALDEALGKGSSGRSVYVPPAPGGADGLAARVTDSQVNETIMTRVSALQACLTDKGGGGGSGGVLKMRWSIAPDGGVQNLKCITPENANTPFASCVSGVLKGLRFPKTQQGRQDVTFPFKF